MTNVKRLFRKMLRDRRAWPKDGTMVLVCMPRMMNLIVRASYSTVHNYWKTDQETDGGITNPTFFHEGDFWMPLPDPPKPPTSQGEQR